MRRFIIAILTAALLVVGSASSVLAYGCDPGRVHAGGVFFAEQRLNASGDTYFRTLESTIEIDRVFTESLAYTDQYLQMSDGQGNYVRIGVNYTNGKAARIFIQGPGVKEYYALSGTAVTTKLRMVRSTASSYLMYANGVYLNSILFGNNWTPKSIKQTVSMSSRGNQVPGHANNAAMFDSVYGTQYGTAAFISSTTYLSTYSGSGDPSFPGGTFIDSNGWYTYDHC